MTQKSESGAAATYANFLSVGHNAFEIVLEFGQAYEGSDRPGMQTRIVTTPAYAKAMLEAFRASIDQYEHLYGTISGVKDPQ